MGCYNCDCDECIEEREQDEMDDEEDEEEESDFGTLPPAPPYQGNDQEIVMALNAIFDQYPQTRINMPALTVMVAQKLNGLKPIHYTQAIDYIHQLCLSQRDKGNLAITIGKSGGVSRVHTLKVESALQSATSTPAINDHTCQHCGNTACSKAERSCWKCGGAL